MDRLEHFIMGALCVCVMLTVWAVGHFWYLHMTQPGRAQYAAELRQRIMSYDKQIFEIILYETAAAIACNDSAFYIKVRQRNLRRLRRWQCQATIVLFYIRCRS